MISRAILIFAVLGLPFSPALWGQTSEAADAPRSPAASLVHPVSLEKPPDVDGFIQRWTILEPIPWNAQLTENAVRASLKTNTFPVQSPQLPKDGEKVQLGGVELKWHAVDTKEYNVNLYHFAYALNKPTSFVLFWAFTVVNCPNEMQEVRLAIGSNAASVWWVNDQEVAGIFGDRQTVVDDGVSRRLTLKKGPNLVRCAVINGGGATDFCARFLDAKDKPKVVGYTLSLGLPAK